MTAWRQFLDDIWVFQIPACRIIPNISFLIQVAFRTKKACVVCWLQYWRWMQRELSCCVENQYSHQPCCSNTKNNYQFGRLYRAFKTSITCIFLNSWFLQTILGWNRNKDHHLHAASQRSVFPFKFLSEQSKVKPEPAWAMRGIREIWNAERIQVFKLITTRPT